MKTAQIQPKYRYFVGIEFNNNEGVENNSDQQSLGSKAKTPNKVADGFSVNKVSNQNKNRSREEEGNQNQLNLKAKYADGYMLGQIKYDYSKILSQKNNKKILQNSPINKLSPVKIQQAIQETNQTKKMIKKQSIDEAHVQQKQNKQPAIYLPFYPQHKIKEFYQQLSSVTQQNFVNPYYQSFILKGKIAKEKQTRIRKQENKTEFKDQNRAEGILQSQKDKSKSPRALTTVLTNKQQMYMCKMDRLEQSTQPVKTKPKKDNSPYLLSYYQNNPQATPLRYNAAPNKSLNRKTNQIYACSMAHLAGQPTHC